MERQRDTSEVAEYGKAEAVTGPCQDSRPTKLSDCQQLARKAVPDGAEVGTQVRVRESREGT